LRRFLFVSLPLMLILALWTYTSALNIFHRKVFTTSE
jgi:hypothetical protein